MAGSFAGFHEAAAANTDPVRIAPRIRIFFRMISRKYGSEFYSLRCRGVTYLRRVRVPIPIRKVSLSDCILLVLLTPLDRPLRS